MVRTRTGTGGATLALITGVAIYGLAMGTTYPLLGIVLSDQVSGTWNGINAAATGLGLVLGVVIVPALVRHCGAGATALAGVALMALSLLAMAIAPQYWLLFVCRMLLGCGANMLFVVAEAALNVFAAPTHRGRVMGAYTAAIALGFVVGPAVVAFAPETPTALLLGCAGVTALAALPLSRARRVVDDSVAATNVGRILPAVIALPFAFAFVLVASAIDAVAISLLPVVALHQGHALQAGALFVAVFHVGLLIGQPVVGAALDGLGRRQTVLGCCLVSFATASALCFADRLGVGPTGLLVFAWGAASYGLYTAGLALIGDRFAGPALTAATAAIAMVYAVASVVSPPLAGRTIDLLGADGLYAAIAAIYLAALAFAGALFQPLEPSLRRR